MLHVLAIIGAKGNPTGIMKIHSMLSRTSEKSNSTNGRSTQGTRHAGPFINSGIDSPDHSLSRIKTGKAYLYLYVYLYAYN